MAKRSEVNQSAEIRSILEHSGKDASFKDVFERLQKKFPGHKFNQNSCMQAFALGRSKLGFTRKRRVKRAVRRSGAAPATNGHHAPRGERSVLDVIRAAKALIAMTGSTSAAKEVIDTL